MSIKKTALVLSLSDPSVSPRPQRALRTVRSLDYSIWLMSPPLASTAVYYDEHFPIKPIIARADLGRGSRLLFELWRYLSSKRATSILADYLFWYLKGAIRYIQEIRKHDFNLILVEDLPLLQLPMRLLKQGKIKSRIIFDARELYTAQLASDKKFVKYGHPRAYIILRSTIPHLDSYYTVCDSIATEYDKAFGRRPLVVRSTPPYYKISPMPLAGPPFRMVHHGVANPDRQLEVMIDIVAELKGAFTLDIYLIGNKEYQDFLRNRIGNSLWVTLKSPMGYDEIVYGLSKYDIGFYFLMPSSLNLEYSLPNKLFEFIQARLATITGPSPEMRRIIDEYKCGAYTPDFAVNSMLRLLKELTSEKIYEMKRNSHRAANELCWEKESEKLKNILEPQSIKG